MIIKENYKLCNKTTFHVGGIAKKLYIPENEQEIRDLADHLYEKYGKLYIISGGSNLLINDSREFPAVISMEKACCDMRPLDEGEFFIGASNRIQDVIKYVNTFDRGGFEALIGLPALFGGIIRMNAGIGGKKNSLFTISDFVVQVRAYDLEKACFTDLKKEECQFTHRGSIFSNGKYVILGAVIKPIQMSGKESAEKIATRKKFCKDHFEWGKGCFGTCFAESNPRILKVLSKFFRSDSKGISFAKKNNNWLVNHGEGTYAQAMRIIKICKFVHKVLLKPCKCEVVIWD